MEEEFVVHGYYTVSNAGGYEIMIHRCGDAAKVREAFGSDNPKTSDWLPITHQFTVNEKGPGLYIDPNGYNIPMDEVMRVNG